MNASSTEGAGVRYYDSRQSRSVWGALVAGLSVIVGGASLAAHSFYVTLGLLVGAIVVWKVGSWCLSKSYYYISDTKTGFKDAFQAREVQFDEIQSVIKNINRSSCNLIFECKTRRVSMPIDTIDGAWFAAVKAELAKRGIPYSASAYGFAAKAE